MGISKEAILTKREKLKGLDAASSLGSTSVYSGLPHHDYYRTSATVEPSTMVEAIKYMYQLLSDMEPDQAAKYAQNLARDGELLSEAYKGMTMALKYTGGKKIIPQSPEPMPMRTMPIPKS